MTPAPSAAFGSPEDWETIGVALAPQPCGRMIRDQATLTIVPRTSATAAHAHDHATRSAGASRSDGPEPRADGPRSTGA